MPISLNTDSASLTHPSSENLMTLIIITGGLLMICLILLIIVVLRSKARRKKATTVSTPIVTKEIPTTEIKKEETKVIVPAAKVVVAEKKVEEEKKQVVEVVIKKEDVKPIVEPKKEEIKTLTETKVPEVKKIEPVVIPEPKKEEVKPVVEIKKPDEVIIKIEEKKPEVKPITTSIDEKKRHFHQVLEETQTKEDNLKILQERLAELTKEKKTTVTFVEPEKKDAPKVEEKKQPEENPKLVDLTALINEKLQVKNEPEPIVKIEEKNEPQLMPPPTVETPEVKKEEESNKVLSPFFDKIKSNQEKPEHEEPAIVIQKIEEELKTVVEKEIEKTKEEKPTETVVSKNKEEAPKTFTEWLSTLKK